MKTSNLVEYLKDFVVQERVQTFLSVLNNRTRYISVLLEDVYQPHNASAVLRSCDCFGIQDIHVVEKRTEFIPDKEITMGSDKWLSISRYGGDTPLEDSLSVLRSKGYRIVATTPHIDDCQMFELDIQKGPFVLMFGSELNGLSQSALDSADEFVKIPMYGFTESLNISVSAAIILQYFSMQIRNLGIDWKLSDTEKDEVMLTWLMKSIKGSKRIVERYSDTKNITGLNKLTGRDTIT